MNGGEPDKTEESSRKITISPDLQHIRVYANLTKTLQARPRILQGLMEEYAEEEVHHVIKQKNNKAHGKDGIPGET